MPHFSRIAKVVIDVPATAEAAAVTLWSAVTGTELVHNARFPEYHGGDLPQGLRMLVQRLEAGTQRVHLDIHTDDVSAEVRRLRGLGASVIGEINGWTVMRDPAGLPFCVPPEPREILIAAHAVRWDGTGESTDADG